MKKYIYMMVLVVISVMGCSQTYTSYEYVSGGSVASSGKASISSSYTYFSNTSPGVLIAFHKEDGIQDWQLSYIMIVKHDGIEPTSISSNSRVGMETNYAYESSKLTVNEYEFNIRYELEDEIKRLYVYGQSYEDGQPRVFLADTTTGALKIEPHQLKKEVTVLVLKECVGLLDKEGDDSIQNALTESLDVLREHVEDVNSFY